MATRAEWTEMVQRWSESGLSAGEFARRAGIEPKRLTWWRWKLSAEPPAPKTKAPLSFLPVRVVDIPTPPEPLRSPIEIVLPHGRIVRVSPGFDGSTLERVLSIVALGDAPC